MLGGANSKKLISRKMLDGAGIEKVDVLGGAGVKNLFSLKMLGKVGIKNPST